MVPPRSVAGGRILAYRGVNRPTAPVQSRRSSPHDAFPHDVERVVGRGRSSSTTSTKPGLARSSCAPGRGARRRRWPARPRRPSSGSTGSRTRRRDGPPDDEHPADVGEHLDRPGQVLHADRADDGVERLRRRTAAPARGSGCGRRTSRAEGCRSISAAFIPRPVDRAEAGVGKVAIATTTSGRAPALREGSARRMPPAAPRSRRPRCARPCARTRRTPRPGSGPCGRRDRRPPSEGSGGTGLGFSSMANATPTPNAEPRRDEVQPGRDAR